VAYWGEGTQMNSPVQLELYLEEEATVLVVELEQQEEKEQLPLMSSKIRVMELLFVEEVIV
jgi:hypothetical protein